jgi:hypothetical protein
MKVWEICNKLKGTESSKEQIAAWAYINRICPVIFKEGLEVNNYPKKMKKLAIELCSKENCGNDCLDKFLESELEP